MNALRVGDTVRERQKVLWVCAPLTLLFTLADVGALGRFSLPVFAVRLLWAALLTGAALLLPRVGERGERHVYLLVAMCSSAFFAWLVLLTGGPRSPMFHWILASPLTIAIVVQDHPRATAAAGITTVICGLGVLALAGEPATVMLPWAIQASGMSAVAVYASNVYRRLRERERALQEARIEDLERLRQVDALERAREHAETAVRARDEFIAVASHELRTPLTSLKLEAQSLLRPHDTPLPPSALVPKLQIIDRQAERLARLLDRLMDLSRVETRGFALELEELDLAALVRDLLFRWETQLRQVDSRLELELSPPLVGRWDPIRVGQILDNLMSNAMKFGQGRPIQVRLGRDGELAVLSVRDFGIGVKPEDQARIFERFERAVSDQHYGGLGLGLYVTRELVHTMGGTLTLQSAPEQGSTFTVRLPVRGPTQLAASSVAR